MWLVGFDREHSTEVRRGENAGQTLREYQVVRSFRDIGKWQGQAVDLVIPATDAKLGDGGGAVLLQVGGSGPIIGAARLKPPTS